MLNLDSAQTPQSLVELTDAVDLAIRKWVRIPDSTRMLDAIGELPRLASLTIDLSGGNVDAAKHFPPHEAIPATEPGPRVELFRLHANPLRVDGIMMQIEVSASGVGFGYGRDKNGQVIVAPQDADDGTFVIELSQHNLEAALLKAVQSGAASSGVAIQKVEVALNSISPRVLEVHLNITAKKFVTAVIRVSGLLSVDEQLNVTATNLKAQGDGMVGSIAGGFIRPHLEKLQGQPISLLQFSLGRIRLCDVAFGLDNGLRISAAFGSTVA